MIQEKRLRLCQACCGCPFHFASRLIKNFLQNSSSKVAVLNSACFFVLNLSYFLPNISFMLLINIVTGSYPEKDEDVGKHRDDLTTNHSSSKLKNNTTSALSLLFM